MKKRLNIYLFISLCFSATQAQSFSKEEKASVYKYALQMYNEAKYDLTIEYCNTIITKQAGDAETYTLKAKAYRYLSDYENAEKNILKALDLEPQNEFYNCNYALFLFQYKKPSPLVYIPEIQKYYRKAIQLDPQKQNLEFEQEFQQVTGQSLR